MPPARRRTTKSPDTRGPMWWRAEDLANGRYRVTLTPEEQRALLRRLACYGQPAGERGDHAANERDDATLRLLATSIRHRLQHAEGFVVLSGLGEMPITAAERRGIYRWLGTRIGEPTGSYGVLFKVCDRGGSYRERSIPVSMTDAATGFHTDSSRKDVQVDAVGLLCERPAPQGGDSFVTNVLHGHERMRQQDPRLLEELYRPVIRNIVTPKSNDGLDALRANRFAVFSQGITARGTRALRFRYMRYWIERGHERAGEPLSPAYVRALDRIDQELSRPEHCVRFGLRTGDMLWLNNWRLAHHRTRYVDDPEQPRCLYRMWLRYRAP